MRLKRTFRPRSSMGAQGAWLLICALLLLLISFYTNNKDAASDPKLTLVVSQSLIENGASWKFCQTNTLGKG